MSFRRCLLQLLTDKSAQALLHNPGRYASFFGFCYTCLLPAISDAPRYARHQFRRHAGSVSLIAGSYANGYIGNDPALKRALEYILWALEWTYGNYRLLTISTKSNDYEPAAKLPSRRTRSLVCVPWSVRALAKP